MKRLVMITLLLLALTTPFSTCVPLKCHFFLSKSDYTCRVQNNTNVFDGSQVTVDHIEGVHAPKHTNNNVTVLVFRKIKNLGSLPLGIGSFFPHITSLVVIDSRLRRINSSDLQPFGKMIMFYAAQNQLTSIAGDLFKSHPRMSSIVLKNNPIASIDRGAFDALPLLEYLDLSGLKCKEELGHADGRMVKKLIEKIRKGACEVKSYRFLLIWMLEQKAWNKI